jgi:WD40 repeat protein
MTGEIYAGLFVCSHDNSVAETAVFSNVRITQPAGPGLVPYRDYLGSSLEIMDVETGHRTVVFQAPNSIQAPNWTPDGRYLIYNSEGLLYRFDLETGRPAVINSGFATSNNNDHVLSFDGRMLGISHHAAEGTNRSIIYIMPAEGVAAEGVRAEELLRNEVFLRAAFLRVASRRAASRRAASRSGSPRRVPPTSTAGRLTAAG